MKAVQAILSEVKLQGNVIPINGGDINQAYRIDTTTESYFLKYHPGLTTAFFQAEVNGLKELRPFVRVPEVYRVGAISSGAFLLMEWIEPGEGDQRDLGRAVAELHRQAADEFGFYEDNYIGVLPQVNAQSSSWVDYYLTCRLDVQVELAKLHNVWNNEREERYLHLKEDLWYNWRKLNVTPCLLHGDLWSGNAFFTAQGQPVLVDPAVSYGDREMDIAMSQLFGGFRAEFFETYQELFPLAEGWQERLPIYQLYYLLVHLNQFGESYGGAVDRILARF